MQPRTKRIFANVRTEGSLLPSDLLQRITDAKDLPGLKAEDYGLTLGETLNEAINRSWTRLQSLWATFQKQRAALPQADAGTTLTRRWLQVVFQELAFGQSLSAAEPILIEGKPYPISHAWKQVPIHLVSFKADLDSRSALTGAKNASPHSLVQELLNRSDNHLWAFLANGLRLRLLRDNVSLTRQAFVEFDLEAIFDSEAYADFRLLWLLCHQSRLEADKPEHCWLEKWTKEAQDTGRRALEQLRQGVQQAIEALGQGFVAHRSNTDLRERLQSGALDKQDYYRQLLRLIYRLIFLFVAEDRDLLLDPNASPEAMERYLKHYSGQRLRRLAERHRGTRHYDLYQGLRLVFDKLGCDEGCPPLALPALGSFLFSPEALPDLQRAEIGNEALLDALRRLALTRDKHGLRLVDFRNLGSEELGSVYESLLELHPEVTTDPATFQLLTASGNERKTTGSYYTPDSLIQCLLDSALDPVLNEAAAKADPEKAILSLKVCDPACGSGHFLIAAAHRIAKRLASIRTGDEAPTPDAQRSALRDVIGHCLYGVDLNPMAVELCKVNLWLEALEPHKPLSFLDHHIRVGNSLLGTSPDLIGAGIPDGAFTFVEGDDKKACGVLKKRNRSECAGWGPLFSQQESELQAYLQQAAAALESLPDARPEDLHAKEKAFLHNERAEEFRHKKKLADAWCAAFFIRKEFRVQGLDDSAWGITQGCINDLASGQTLPSDLDVEIESLADQFRFFHWHLAFPDVVAQGGFDVVLGNPPWDKIQPEEEKFFATLRPDIAFAESAKKRKALIQELPWTDATTHQLWASHKRGIDSACQFLGASGVLRFTSEGNLNTYRIFTEISTTLLSRRGRAGLVVQTGLATDESGKELFSHLISTNRLVRFLDFENKQTFFTDVHAQFRFALITHVGSGIAETNSFAEFGWLLHSIDEIQEPDRLVRLAADDLLLFNPTSKTCPVLVSPKDLEISRRIYRKGVHVFLSPSERLGHIDFLGELFNMTRDSRFFLSRESGSEVETLPLYEAKYLHQFDHRFATTMGSQLVEPTLPQRADTHFFAQTSRVVDAQEARKRLGSRGISTPWLCGFRSIASATNERTSIVAIFPTSAVGNSINLVLGLTALEAALITANANSFVFDYCCRAKVSGSNVNIWIFKQLPAIPLERYAEQCPWTRNGESFQAWLIPRILELSYTSWDLQPFAQDCGFDGPPFIWDEERRFQIRCELDAAFFHLYGLTRDEVAYLMDTFPIVRRKDEAAFGKYQTKDVILDLFSAFSDAAQAGRIDTPSEKALPSK